MKGTSIYQEQDFFRAASPAELSPEKPAASVLALPNKTTCRPNEAAAALGVSARQIRYWVEDGTLLAVDSSRNPTAKDRPAGKLRRWRVVVRRRDGSPVPAANEFLTLAELLPRITNKEIQ